MRITYEPTGCRCPFCELLAGRGSEINALDDIVRRVEGTAAFVAPRWWPNNPGHALVVPTAHHENLYSIPSDAYRAVGDLVREIGIAIRETYGCGGVEPPTASLPVAVPRRFAAGPAGTVDGRSSLQPRST